MDSRITIAHDLRQVPQSLLEQTPAEAKGVEVNRADINLLIDKGLLTVGHVRHVIDMASCVEDLSRPSRVNPSITKMHALGIFQAGVFVGRDDSDIVGKGWRKPDGSPSYTETSDRLKAVNVLREFGNVDGASLVALLEKALGKSL